MKKKKDGYKLEGGWCQAGECAGTAFLEKAFLLF